MNNYTQQPCCLICGSDQHSPYLKVPNRFNPQELFQLVRCKNCKFVFLSPRPDEEEILPYYDEENYQPHRQDAISFTDKIYQGVRIWNNRYKRKLIEKLSPKGKILDYGCGTGEFLLEMKQNDWEATGFEPSLKAREVVRSYGIEMTDDIRNLDKKYAVITLWHVLEHVYDPDHLVQEFKKLLGESGYLLIAVPNRKSFDAKTFHKNWVAYDAPRHLYHFRPADMQRFLEKNGFILIYHKRLSFDAWYNSLLSASLESGSNRLRLVTLGLLKSLYAATVSSLSGFFNVKKNASIIYVAQAIKN